MVNQMLKQIYVICNVNTIDPNIYGILYFPEGGMGNLGISFYTAQRCKKCNRIGLNKTTLEDRKIKSLAQITIFLRL